MVGQNGINTDCQMVTKGFLLHFPRSNEKEDFTNQYMNIPYNFYVYLLKYSKAVMYNKGPKMKRDA